MGKQEDGGGRKPSKTEQPQKHEHEQKMPPGKPESDKAIPLPDKSDR